MKDYREFLARVDAWYRDIKARHPEQVPCSKGCRDCCLGLFDVSMADRQLLREGLAAADAATRADIVRRADEIVRKLREVYPDLGDDLDEWDARDIDDLCDELPNVECPVLGPGGECRLYEHRPLTCRLAGVPIVDEAGGVVYPEGCAKCTLKPAETPRIDYARLRRSERKVLKPLGGASLLIPQALYNAGPNQGDPR